MLASAADFGVCSIESNFVVALTVVCLGVLLIINKKVMERNDRMLRRTRTSLVTGLGSQEPMIVSLFVDEFLTVGTFL